MRVYHGTTLVGDQTQYGEFVRRLGAAVVEHSVLPFLLVRSDGKRLQIVTSDGSVMLCLAGGPNDCNVSFTSSYVEAPRGFRGLICDRVANERNFVDPVFALKAVEAFFQSSSLSEFVDFQRGCPDADILSFPDPIVAAKRVERKQIERSVEAPPELRTDMQAVCEYLDEVADDPDENIDFDDAIQIGSLCGGRVDSRNDRYLFSYYQDSGDVWSFEFPRTVLIGIADGSITKFKVTAYVPK